MTTTHETVSWTAGDDWQLNVTLQDASGAPFDLSGTPDIRWALMNPAFQRALDQDDVDIVVTDAAAGKCSINIPAAKSSPLVAGRYTDVVRIVHGGVTSTLSYGGINVAADPWIAAEVVVPVAVPAPPGQLAKLRRVV